MVKKGQRISTLVLCFSTVCTWPRSDRTIRIESGVGDVDPFTLSFWVLGWRASIHSCLGWKGAYKCSDRTSESAEACRRTWKPQNVKPCWLEANGSEWPETSAVGACARPNKDKSGHMSADISAECSEKTLEWLYTGDQWVGDNSLTESRDNSRTLPPPWECVLHSSAGYILQDQ